MLVRTHRAPGLVLRDHWFDLPVDHGRPDGAKLRVFAREAVLPAKADANLPWLVFLQGGPGYEAPRPTGASGWLKRALREFRVLLLDQRGTGLSAPIDALSLARAVPPAAQADYLACFRQEQIVRDLEVMRAELADGAKWTLLGQSWGGFLATHYLSAAPEALEAVLITGGIPPILESADDVYRATYRRVLDRNQRYFARYPADAELLRTLARRCERENLRLPNGDRLSARRLQQLGLAFGMSDGFEVIHYLLELAGGSSELPQSFLIDVERIYPFARNPIYALLQEAIYAQRAATGWSADRILSEFPQFELADGKEFRFTGEMVYPWMFDECEALAPLREAAHGLARKDDWAPLYDLAKLARNQVPAAAAVYHDDMYVECGFSERAAAAIPNLRLWITNEYDHNGLRADGERIVDRLLAMTRGEI